ncbi:intracellular proteinase inhibitor [Bacillus sp. DTU_2020_1000418_1_SI_GHA_SEK_038]|uniref:intracellular proteinase inhibitor n=1 Tax=Bacillus sp. DTU_2020_1000418_1_SI_GHA_SEK_038 TaxID=3077585 RepID=UPI0028E77EF3|nr:intracellular proteinase inhibitor [Bacillus sp. DTU_2020_1000418_1_SI_GHA_SEK_038]WNS76831.1 intracellular proteinase inhibitor [Bacillus sp. DTU_2020_1000418_1_SI_GHA_SEK_038]
MLQILISYLVMMGSLSTFAGEMIKHPLVSYEEKEEAAVENNSFRKIQVSGEKGRYRVIGEARSNSGKLFYVVEDGHNELISEKKLEMNEKFPLWSKIKIKINIPKEEMPESGTIILYLYGRNEEGQMINELPIILEKVQQADS